MHMNNRRSRPARVSRVLGATLLGLGFVGMSTLAYAKKDNDNEGPEKGIKHRVDALEDQVANLNALAYPVEVNVDCSAGQTVSNALADHQLESGPLTIQVSGVCNDTFTITRSNVLIQGNGDAQIVVPAGTIFGIAVTDNASHVEIRGITLTAQLSATAGILATKGAHLVLRDVTALTAASGVMALDGGVIDMTGGAARGNGQGLYAGRNGVIVTSNTIIESNTVGALAFKAGAINLTAIGPDLRTGVGPTIVRNNVTGVSVRSGGMLELAGAFVENNQNYGVAVDTGSSVHLFPLGVDGNRITGNGLGGFFIGKNGNFAVNGTTNTITGNLRGIVCSPNAGYLVPVGFTVTGNASGDIIGCVP